MKGGTLLLSQKVQAICFVHKLFLTFISSIMSSILIIIQVTVWEIKIILHRKKDSFFISMTYSEKILQDILKGTKGFFFLRGVDGWGKG